MILIASGVDSVDFFFFFQAEDGIRDYKVTGVQTCALPISMGLLAHRVELQVPHQVLQGEVVRPAGCRDFEPGWFAGGQVGERVGQDRKSTRLNSSHLVISYAVFCLKKKNRTIERMFFSISLL